MHRDNVQREQVLERMNNQLDESIKMKLCDFVVINDEQEAVLPQVLRLHHMVFRYGWKKLIFRIIKRQIFTYCIKTLRNYIYQRKSR
jgi:hypothetical protein